MNSIVLDGNTLETGRAKLQSIIENGRGAAEAAIAKLQADRPQDMVVPAAALRFDVNGDIKVRVDGNEADPMTLHELARYQMAERAGLPCKFIERLEHGGDWGKRLLAHNLTEVFGHTGGRNLLRSVRGEVRGFLSDRYRRMDTPVLVESFAAASATYGLAPIEAVCTDTKFVLKAALPQVVEILPGEPIVLGVAMLNSDFGNGAFELRMFAMRIWCKNLAVCEDGLRRVHLGSRIDENIALSQKTYELDSKTLASATADVLDGMFEPKAIEGRMTLIKQAAETKVDIKRVLDGARKAGSISVGETKQVTDIYNTAGIEMLPPGDNAWRLSNAISYFAQTPELKPERKVDLEVLAGRVAGLHQ